MRPVAAAIVVLLGAAGVARIPPAAFVLAAAQEQPGPRGQFMGPPPAPSPTERLGPGLLRIGNIRVDTTKKEISVAGFVNDVQVLEFLANTKGGFKAYETALELDTNAVNFNVACILIGLDPARAVHSRQQFDPVPPQGDPVDIFVEWDENGSKRRVRAEELIYNKTSKTVLTTGPWVYTGSAFTPSTEGNSYLAERDGTLIGFMHNTQPIIESPRRLVGNYGDDIINPALNLKAGTTVQLTVRALTRAAAAK